MQSKVAGCSLVLAAAVFAAWAALRSRRDYQPNSHLVPVLESSGGLSQQSGDAAVATQGGLKEQERGRVIRGKDDDAVLRRSVRRDQFNITIGSCPAFVHAARQKATVLLKNHDRWCFKYGCFDSSFGFICNIQKHYRPSDSHGLKTFSYVDIPKCGSTTMRSKLKLLSKRSEKRLLYSEIALGERWCKEDDELQPCGYQRNPKDPPIALPLPTYSSTVKSRGQRYYYTFLRDPVDRFFSAWQEIEFRIASRPDNRSIGFGRYVWGEGAGLPPASSHGTPEEKSLVLKRMEALLVAMEQSTSEWPSHVPFNEHLTAQTAYLAQVHPLSTFSPWWNPPSNMHHLFPESAKLLRLDFVGHVQQLDAAVANVVREMNKHFQWDIPLESSSRRKGAAGGFSKDDVPEDLLQRICSLYKVDYCCLGLPRPKACPPLDCYEK